MSDRDVKTGFRDPEDNFPSLSYMFRMSSDVAQEAQVKNVLSSTWLDQRLARLDRGIPISYAGAKEYEYDEEFNPHYTYEFWGEPIPAYNAEYPYNEFRRSESGHIHEVDDTPGHERLNQQHRTGTYEEIDENGSRSQKIIGSNYEIVCGDEFVYIKGRTSVTVDGSHHLLVLGDCYREVSGNETVLIRGNKTERIGGNLHQEITGDNVTKVKGNKHHRSEGNEISENIGFKYHWNQGNTYYGTGGERTDVAAKSWTMGSGADMNIGAIKTMYISSEKDMAIQTDAALNISASGKFQAGSDTANMELQAGGNVDIDGTKVNLNTTNPGTDFKESDVVDVEEELKRTEPSEEAPFVHKTPEKLGGNPARPGHSWSKCGIFDHIRNMFKG